MNINRILNILIIFSLALFCISAISAEEIGNNATELSTNIDITQENTDIKESTNDENLLSEGEITISDSEYPNATTIYRDVGSVTLNFSPYVFSYESDVVYLTINGYTQAVAYVSTAKSNGITFTFTEAGTYNVYATSTESLFGTTPTSNTLVYVIGGGGNIDPNKTYETTLTIFDNETSGNVIYKKIGSSATFLNNLSNSELGSSIIDAISYTNSDSGKQIQEKISVYCNGEYIGQIAVSPNGEWANGATLSFDKAGWYNFTATYAGNSHLSSANSNVLAYYVGESGDEIYNVTTTQISVTPSEIILGNSSVISPKVYDSSNNEITSGNIEIYVNGNKNATINTGASYTLTPTSSGTYDIYAKFLNDGTHGTSTSNTIKLTVTEKDVTPTTAVDTKTTVNLNQTRISWGNSVLITPNVVDKDNKAVKSGNVVISVNDMNMTTICVGDNYEYAPFLWGDYEIKAYYLGNDNYNPSSSNIINLEVIFGDLPDDNKTDDNKTDQNSTDDNKTDVSILNTTTKVNVSPSEVILGQEVTIIPTVIDQYGKSVGEGNVRIYIDDMLVTTIGVGSNYKISLSDIGSYKTYATYVGSDNYNPSTSDEVKFKVIQDDKNTTPIDNNTNSTPIENNTNTTPVDNNTNYTNDTPIDTSKLGVILYAYDVEMFYKDGTRFSAKLTDKINNPIKNETLTFNINGINYDRTTDNDGMASMAINLQSNIYSVNVTYAGSDKYEKAKNNATINVKSTIVAKDIIKMFRNGTNYQATFLDSNGNSASGVNITFNINGVMYNRVTDSDGIARLNINLAPGEYIITAYNSVNGQEFSNNIVVLSPIINNENIVKYYRNGTQYLVRLLGYDGNPVGAGENVTFNINGVFYTRTTNESGWAKININLQPGDYIITAEYHQCRVSNNITVLSTMESSDLFMTYKDGSSFNVKILDEKGNAYPNQLVTFNINGVFYYKTTDSNGMASLNINLMSGEYIITSTFNGLNKSDKITIA